MEKPLKRAKLSPTGTVVSSTGDRIGASSDVSESVSGGSDTVPQLHAPVISAVEQAAAALDMEMDSLSFTWNYLGAFENVSDSVSSDSDAIPVASVASGLADSGDTWDRGNLFARVPDEVCVQVLCFVGDRRTLTRCVSRVSRLFNNLVKYDSTVNRVLCECDESCDRYHLVDLNDLKFVRKEHMVDTVLAYFQYRPYLRHVKFRYNFDDYDNTAISDIIVEIFRGISQALETSSICSIDFSGLCMSDDYLSVFTTALESNTTVHTLKFSDCSLSELCCKLITEALERNTTVHTIDLSFNEFSDENLEDLVGVLERNSTLRSIDLSDNKFGSHEISLFAEVLERNTTLQSFNVSTSDIAYEGACHLAEMLVKNTTLRTLDVSDSEINDEGVVRLAEALERNTALYTLNLSRGNFTDVGVCRLAEMLGRNTTLHTMVLGECDVTDRSAKQIEEALKSNTTLRMFDIVGNQMSPKIQDRLKELGASKGIKIVT